MFSWENFTKLLGAVTLAIPAMYATIYFMVEAETSHLRGRVEQAEHQLNLGARFTREDGQRLQENISGNTKDIRSHNNDIYLLSNSITEIKTSRQNCDVIIITGLERRLDRLEDHVFRYPLGRNDHGKKSQ